MASTLGGPSAGHRRGYRRDQAGRRGGDNDGRVLARLRRDTPAHDPDKVQDVIAQAIGELTRDHEVEAAGLGTAGFVDAARSTVLFPPNLAWRNEPLRAAVEQRTGLPVVVENDANAAAWARPALGPATASGSRSPSPSAPVWAAGWSWVGSWSGGRSGRRPRSAT
jgi:ROK family